MADLTIYESKLHALEAKYNQKFGELTKLQSQSNMLVVQIKDLEKSVIIDDFSRSALEALSKTTEASVKGYIEPLITEALQAVFGYNRIEGESPATGLFTVPVVNVNSLSTGWGDGFDSALLSRRLACAVVDARPRAAARPGMHGQ